MGWSHPPDPNRGPLVGQHPPPSPLRHFKIPGKGVNKDDISRRRGSGRVLGPLPGLGVCDGLNRRRRVGVKIG